MVELKLANDFMKRRGGDWSCCWELVPPLDWVESELRYWMPALVRYPYPTSGPWSLDIRFGRVVLAIIVMFYDLLYAQLH